MPLSVRKTRNVRFAAVDLGSNSFHMVIATNGSGVNIIDREKEMVRLKAGMDASHRILPDVEARALACLRRFRQKLDGLDGDHVMVVGTDAMRKAENADAFRESAEDVLGHPVHVISGIDEARLIYAGVDHFMDDSPVGTRMVVDIGGGSTEIIIGDHEQVLDLHSFELGCVSFTDHYFPDGRLTRGNLEAAFQAACDELILFNDLGRRFGVQDVIGSSGTARAIEGVIGAAEWSTAGITRTALERLVEHMLEVSAIDELALEGLSEERRQVFPAGVMIMRAVFETMGFDFMHTSDYALREGVLLELIERYEASS